MNSYKPSFLNGIPPVVKNLLAINIIFWLASTLTPDLFQKLGVNTNLDEILGLHYWASPKFNPAQFVTYMFMHAGFFHIFMNIFGLYMFGGVLENLWGSKRFLFYYIFTGIGAGIVQQIFWTVEFQPLISALNEAIATKSAEGLANHLVVLSQYFRIENLNMADTPALLEMKRLFLNSPSLVTVGASGALFGLLLAFWWLFPDAKMMVFPLPIPIKARILIPLYGLYELYQGYLRNPTDNVAHFAHLGGMFFGAIIIFYWKKKHIL